MNKKLSLVLIGFGFLFILYAILGRYLVLPGYLASLEQGQNTAESVSQSVPAWKIIRYLLWAYAFKLGIYFVALGAAARTKMPTRHKWYLALGGFLYLSFAYLPLPNPGSFVFGLGGVLMTLFMIFAFWRWASNRDSLPENRQAASDYRLVGYFFFAAATYTLCAFMGVKTFALEPEKMIQYGLQAEAASFALHILIELVLGWLFTALSFRKQMDF